MGGRGGVDASCCGYVDLAPPAIATAGSTANMGALLLVVVVLLLLPTVIVGSPKGRLWGCKRWVGKRDRYEAG